MKLKMKKIDAIIIVIMIVIAGIVFYKIGFIPKKEELDIPDIQFIKDDESKILIVKSVSENVLWENILIEGNCNKNNLGRFVTKGDKITDCVGIITIRPQPTDTLVHTYKFEPAPRFPYSILPGYMRDVSPEDEGVHLTQF